jgi:hypothetical protein
MPDIMTEAKATGKSGGKKEGKGIKIMNGEPNGDVSNC